MSEDWKQKLQALERRIADLERRLDDLQSVVPLRTCRALSGDAICERPEGHSGRHGPWRLIGGER